MAGGEVLNNWPEYLDAIVVAVLTVVGFWLQYQHFEKKLGTRDTRDLFLRRVEEPIAQILRDIDRAVMTAESLRRRPNQDIADAVFVSMGQASRELNRLINMLSKGKFDSGDGWISIDTEQFDESIAAFSASCEPGTIGGLVHEAESINRKVKAVLDGCRSKEDL